MTPATKTNWWRIGFIIAIIIAVIAIFFLFKGSSNTPAIDQAKHEIDAYKKTDDSIKAVNRRINLRIDSLYGELAKKDSSINNLKSKKDENDKQYHADRNLLLRMSTGQQLSLFTNWLSQIDSLDRGGYYNSNN